MISASESPRSRRRAAIAGRLARPVSSASVERRLQRLPRAGRRRVQPDRPGARRPWGSPSTSSTPRRGRSRAAGARAPGARGARRRRCRSAASAGSSSPTRTGAGTSYRNASRIRRSRTEVEVSPVTAMRRPPSSAMGRSEKRRTLCARVGPTIPNGRRVTVPSRRRQSARASGPASTRPAATASPSGAGRQRRRDRPREGVEERLDVQVRDPADPQHQLHTLTTL